MHRRYLKATKELKKIKIGFKEVIVIMRKYAFTRSNSSHEIPKVMIFETDNTGVYVFLFKSIEDRPSHNAFWFEELEDAEAFCKQYFDINKDEWVLIEDPHEECQHDLIRPIRLLKNSSENKLEMLINNEWKQIEL